jgi:hypothetical protein
MISPRMAAAYQTRSGHDRGAPRRRKVSAGWMSTLVRPGANRDAVSCSSARERRETCVACEIR